MNPKLYPQLYAGVKAACESELEVLREKGCENSLHNKDYLTQPPIVEAGFFVLEYKYIQVLRKQDKREACRCKRGPAAVTGDESHN